MRKTTPGDVVPATSDPHAEYAWVGCRAVRTTIVVTAGFRLLTHLLVLPS